MRYIADLHIHSHYSRATSKASHLYGLAAWAQIKGINVIGTGDFTHPRWYQELRDNLIEAEPGFFKLKPCKKEDLSELVPPCIVPDISNIRFVLTAEISSIYKRHDRVRKVHNLIFAPDFDSVSQINSTLAGLGNIESDGRPILGLDSRDLLEIVLEKIPDGFLVPAHIWTPWFSLFGSKSGFESIEECFADLSPHIFALETGLSSDPEMNRLVSALDRFTLISNSDCHSPAKLGREANIFNTDFDFYSMADAIRFPTDLAGRQQFEASIEFFPEEGKYHNDGHRKCGVSLEPEQTRKCHGVCPACGRPVTVGVLNRVMELADRQKPCYPPGSPGVYSLIPLAEVLGELVGVGSSSKKVANVYALLISKLGSEFEILLRIPIEEIKQIVSPVLGEAINRIREKRVMRQPGFDGEFGAIKVFSEEQRLDLVPKMDLFGVKASPARKKANVLKKK